MTEKVFIIPTAVAPKEARPEKTALFFFPNVHEFRHLGEVMENPLLGPESQAEAERYIERCYERMMAKVTVAFNKLHGVDRSQMYWEIVLGGWIHHFIGIAYSRYLHMKAAIAAYGKANLILYSNLDPLFPTRGCGDLVQGTCVDECGSSAFYGEMAHQLGIECEKVEIRDEAVRRNATRWRVWSLDRRLIKMYVRHIVSRIARMVRDSFIPSGELAATGEAALFHHMGVGDSELRQMDIPGGYTIFPHHEFVPRGVAVDRESVASIIGDDEFETISFGVMSKMCPTAFLEEFRSFEAEACKWGGFRLYGYYSPLYDDDHLFRFVAAEGKRRSGKIVICQAGGGYGHFAVHMCEYYERRISDYYLTWGWNDNYYKGATLVPLSLPKFASYEVPNSGNGYALYISTSLPGYCIRLMPYPLMPEYQEMYHEWKRIFFSTLHKRVLREVVYRPYPHDYGFTPQEMAHLRSYNEVVFENTLPFMMIMQSASLVICDHLSTTLLQSLVLNRPTICFWEKRLVTLRDGVADDFALLGKAGILFSTPEDAARQVNNIWPDVQGWWGHPDRQEARACFVAKYCKSDPIWEKNWHVAFQGMLDEGSVVVH